MKVQTVRTIDIDSAEAFRLLCKTLDAVNIFPNLKFRSAHYIYNK